MKTSRRQFLKTAGAGSALLTVGGVLPGFSAASYSRIVGANERVNVSIIGVNSRGDDLARNFARQSSVCEVAAICDVDKRAIEKTVKNVQEIQNKAPKGERDFRKSLENKNIDAVVIATPDHWHTPAALLALQAGKHVYLEKPVSYCPREGEMLIEATAKYGKVVQIGTQRRSFPRVVEAIQEVQNGAIGKVHFGKSWYANNRPSIGVGKIAAVPDWLNWDLWQGPAPRTVYKDNVVHYNWHWFWHWGTGEALNNGTHMVDLLRWGMDLDYPTQTQSTGGRYYYKDDWEAPDTQVINFDFEGKKSFMWEGHSCNSFKIEGGSVGAMFYGDKANLLIQGGNTYKIFDHKNNVIKDVQSNIAIDPRNLMNPSERLDAFHLQNFLDGIKKGTKLFSDMESGHKSTLLVQLGNIAQRTGETLQTDPKTGRITVSKEANKLWRRSYEKGWEMKL